MNYRHAFHAGNFADVHKHAVLGRVLAHLRLKPAPFRVIDTHAGAGRYDLSQPEPARTGEWRHGIARVWEASLPAEPQRLLAPYLGVVSAFNPSQTLGVYPGSPLIAQSLLRPQDRLIACELEPTKTLPIDGWTALGAYVPPKERRGLVLVDPPFEEAADFARLAGALAAAYRKWPTGIYVLWYPIKERAAPDALALRLRRLAVPKLLRSELTLGPPPVEGGLFGSGLIVVNPPFTLEAELQHLMPALGAVLSPQAAHRLDWLAPERSPPASKSRQ